MKKRTNLFNDGKTIDEFTGEETALLFLIPLIQTAWVCGAVSPREKQLIYESAREDSIDPRHQFNDVINEWLNYQPSQAFFDSCISMINETMGGMTNLEKKKLKAKILNRCKKVAASAGGKSPMDIDHHTSIQEDVLIKRLSEIIA